MVTFWPAELGSVSTSWYPLSAVLNTTSPVVSPVAPKDRPSKTRPSSRASTAVRGALLTRTGDGSRASADMAAPSGPGCHSTRRTPSRLDPGPGGAHLPGQALAPDAPGGGQR